MNHSLTILILVPLLGGLIVAGTGSANRNLARGLSLFYSLI